MRALKQSFVLPLAFLTAACSTFGEKSVDVGERDPDAYSAPRDIEMQSQVARLQTENARLANRVLELQRENDRLKKTAASEAPATDDIELASAPPDRLEPPSDATAALREPQVAQPPVVDNPDTPEMTQTEVPVEPAPRLTQPTFSATDSVFENEAESPAVAAAAEDLFGVHLASYRQETEAREGWRKLQRENPDELGLLEPRLETVEVPERGNFLRLIGGGFSNREKAEALCSNLKMKGLFCSVSTFSGEKLSLKENTG